jgi:hypothetical protein
MEIDEINKTGETAGESGQSVSFFFGLQSRSISSATAQSRIYSRYKHARPFRPLAAHLLAARPLPKFAAAPPLPSSAAPHPAAW